MRRSSLPNHPHETVAKRQRVENAPTRQTSPLFYLPEDLWPLLRDLAGAADVVRLAETCRQARRLVRLSAFWADFEQPVFDLGRAADWRILRFLAPVCAQPLRKVQLGSALYPGYRRDGTLRRTVVESLFLYNYLGSADVAAVLDEPGCLYHLLAVQAIDVCRHLRDRPRLWGLRSLALLGGNVSDDSLGILRELRALENLALGSCDDVTDGGLRQLAHVPRLSRLSLAHCRQIAGHGLHGLQLTELKLGSLDRTSEQTLVDCVSSLTRLERLDLCVCVSTPFSDLECLGRLSVLPLQSLRLGLSYIYGDAHLDAIIRMGWPSLQALRLSNSELTAEGLTALRNCPALTELELVSFGNLEDLSALHPWPTLRKLTLTCRRSPGEVPAGLAGLAGLQKLSLREYFLTDDVVSELRHCPSLQELELCWCWARCDLSRLQACRALRLLTAYHCYDLHVHALCRARPDLRFNRNPRGQELDFGAWEPGGPAGLTWPPPSSTRLG